MISKRQIKVEREGLVSLKNLVEVYEEMAAGRMQSTRGAVLSSRQFLEGLLGVFIRVKEAYNKLDRELQIQRPRNGKIVAVFVSANAGLYGDIVDRTFELFAQFVEKNKCDVVILGKLGLKMMGERLPQVLYNYYDFADEGVDIESFDMIMRYLIQFEKILVFYGRFKTILSQDPVMTSVSGDSLEEEVAKVVTAERKAQVEERLQFLFEPSVTDIARVFEGEILASLFEQTLHESQLAKFASRLLALDRSIDNIEKRMVVMRGEERRVLHKQRNRKQLSTISGISLWTH